MTTSFEGDQDVAPTRRERAVALAEEAALRARAFWAVLTSTSDDLSQISARSIAWRFGCLAAIALGRRHIAHVDDHLPLRDPRCALHAVTLASFGHEQLYAGWRAEFVRFHPRQFRFEIEADGDWNM